MQRWFGRLFQSSGWRVEQLSGSGGKHGVGRWFDGLLTQLAAKRRVLDQGENAVGHEAGCPHGGAAARHLDYFDDASARVDLDPSPVSGRDDVVGADLTARIDDDLDSIPAHALTVTPRTDTTSPMELRPPTSTDRGGRGGTQTRAALS